MPKALHNDVLDGTLNIIKNNATKLVVCGTEPTTFTEANVTYMLCEVIIDSADFTGPAEGDVSGRKLTVNAQAGVVPTVGGTSGWVCVLDVDDSKLLGKTTCPAKTFDTDDLVDVAAWDLELADPT